MKIRMSDLRSVGVCDRVRFWFRKHGLDWADFLKNGIEDERLLRTGDAQAFRVVEEIRGRS